MIDFELNLSGAILAHEVPLPPMRAQAYEYIVAAGGLYIRAEDTRMEALVPVAPAALHGLAEVETYARLSVPRVPVSWLWAIHRSAVAHLPDEVMYQLYPDVLARNSAGGWACVMPEQKGSRSALTFQDVTEAVVDLHSHNSMDAFFSSTDDADELGLRFYCVIGKLDTDRPEIAARVGVYGHHMRVPALTVFGALGPFIDRYSELEADLGTDAVQASEVGDGNP